MVFGKPLAYRVRTVRDNFIKYICHPSSVIKDIVWMVFYDKMLKRYRNSRNNSRNWELIYIFANKFSITMQIIFDDKDLEELWWSESSSANLMAESESQF